MPDHEAAVPTPRPVIEALAFGASFFYKAAF
jgi:hypothetical protein